MTSYAKKFKTNLGLEPGLICDTPKNLNLFKKNFTDKDLDSLRNIFINWENFDGGYRQVFISKEDFVVKIPIETSQQAFCCQILEYMRSGDIEIEKSFKPLSLGLPKTELIFIKGIPVLLMEKVLIKDSYPFLDLATDDLEIDEDVFNCFLESKFKSFSSNALDPLNIQRFEILKEISVQYGFNSLGQKILYDLGGYGELIEFYMLENNSFHKENLVPLNKPVVSEFSFDQIKYFEYF